MTDRLETLQEWLDWLGLPPFRLTSASSDASFRRYFRLQFDDRSLIAMDAPPPQEDCAPFVGIARAFVAIGINVPEIVEQDLDRGFVLMSDLGTRLYLAELNEDNVDRLYGDALAALVTLQACGPGDYRLPSYDEALLRRELALFGDWYLQRHLQWRPHSGQIEALAKVDATLVANAIEQPQVCVHRDYHSRNLLLTQQHNPGVLDFQDAVLGPVTYDLVSLLRDCYIAWPRSRVEDWALGFHDLALQSGILHVEDPQLFLRWFDLMGVQRHLKASGIFARLHHRDGKPGYLQDIPRTLAYVRDVAGRYLELTALQEVLETLPGQAGSP